MGLPGIAEAAESIEPESAYAVLAKAQKLERAGRDVIHLEIGEPDFATEHRINQAGIAAINAGQTRYNPTAGIGPLREAIAAELGRRSERKISASEVVVGPGAKPLLFLPTLAIIEAGDEVIYPDPGFPTYEAMVRVAGGKGVPVPLVEANGFSFDLDVLRQRISERTKLIVLNSPSNPTGGVIPLSDLEEVAKLAQRHNCWVLSDEIYSRMCFDGVKAPSVASIDGMAERTIVVDGFSKTYAMTGWRLGYGVMPERLASKVNLLAVHAFGCTAQFTQFAGLEAITGPQTQIDTLMAEYQRRRDVLVDGLNSITGISCRKPAGAFYAFPNVQSLGESSEAIADRLLSETGVALLPGNAFGAAGEGYLRICFAKPIPELLQAVERMRAFFG
ncbi:MAG: pyridoxal phosphate-dependent aminotransferase [Rubripirellula sp.]|nr:pyridoxal phosphate-dependent aminotransferase [Rubripirellula sp.]